MLTASRRLAEILTVSRKSPRLIEILMETEKFSDKVYFIKFHVVVLQRTATKYTKF